MVQGGGHWLRSAHHRAHDYLIHGLAYAQAKAFDHLGNRRRAVVFDRRGGAVASIAIGQRIAAGPFGEAQFVNIARERGLGYREAAPAELAAQLVLVGDQPSWPPGPGSRCAVAAS